MRGASSGVAALSDGRSFPRAGAGRRSGPTRLILSGSRYPREESVMARKLLPCIVTVCFVVAAALPVSAREAVGPVDGSGGDPHSGGVRADFAYNTAGALGYLPEYGGSNLSWAQWFVTAVHNDTGIDLLLTEFGFPCCGPATGDYGWVVWVDVGGMTFPAGGPTTADYHGGFTPLDQGPCTIPVSYTYVNVVSEGIIVPPGGYFVFGYQNTDHGGLTLYNGTETWGWDSVWEEWWSDSVSGYTAVLQVKADYVVSGLEKDSWGGIKSLYR